MTTPAIDTDGLTVYQGDLFDVLPTLPPDTFDAIVTDPPYGLEFMGEEWDTFGPQRAPSTAGRVGDGAIGTGATIDEDTGSRYGRITYGAKRPTTSRCSGCGKRDQFRNPHPCTPDATWAVEPINPNAAPPGSVALGQWAQRWALELYRVIKPGGWLVAFGGTRTYHRVATGIEDAGFEIHDSLEWLYATGFPKGLDVGKALDDPDLAAEWAGWNTQLKPGHEPIVLARRPLIGSTVANIAEHGTGALNIAATRVDYTDPQDLAKTRAKNPGRSDTVTSDVYGADRPQQAVNEDGRYTPNVTTGCPCPNQHHPDCPIGALGPPGKVFPLWRLVPKATTTERPNTDTGDTHPTVKPLDLMVWLVRLTTRPGGLILDPFAGTGTTGAAAIAEHRRVVLIEREPVYVDLIRQRLTNGVQLGMFTA